MKTHTVTFYLDPALITTSTPSDLAQYVSDMNFVLAKNTDRRLEFDPQTGVIPATAEPHDNSHDGPLPSEGFGVWIHATFSGTPNYTTGGYCGIHSGGELVIAGMKWGGVYSSFSADYAKQIYTMLHEFAHGFGAGIGELYSLIFVQDRSNQSPTQDLNLLMPSDPFALTHPDWRGDPLLWNVGGNTREEFLANCTFSELTARVLGSTWRTMPDPFDRFTVQVSGATSASAKKVRIGGPVRDIPFQVYVYSRSGLLLQAGETDGNGRYVVTDFGWFAHTSATNVRLVKVFQGVRFVGQKWVSVYDLDLARLRGQSEYVVTIP